MIRLFRKIRHQLLSEDKYSTYLLYASGEVLLVVVGILLAFQIDNWGDIRKSGLLADSLLEELHENLESDVAQSERNISLQKSIILSIDIITLQHENKAPYHDSMKYHYVKMHWVEDFSVVSTAYQSLKSMGTENATASELKKNIAYHYDVRYAGLNKIVNRENDFFSGTFHELNLKHFRIISNREGMIPTDYEALLHDPSYLNYLYNRKGWKRDYINFQNTMIRAAEKLMAEIKQELEK